MAIIYSYPLNSNILPTDILVCTSTVLVGGKPKNQTKSISIANLSTYVITNPSNNLNQVLANGNTSLLDAKIGELYLYDITEQEYGKIRLYDSGFNFYNNLGANIAQISKEGIVFFPNAYNAQILATTITGSRQYQLPDQSGTIALASNIPTVGVVSINGLATSAQSLVAANSGTNFSISSSGSTHTFNIPNAGLGISRGLITNETQTIYGAKTFDNSILRLKCGNSPAETATMQATTNGFYFKSTLTSPLYHYLANGWHVMYNSAGTASGSLETSALTGNRTYILPDASGTFALTSDIPAQGITSLNGLTTGIQTFATGTAGTDFGISSASLTGTHTFNLPDASLTARGVVTANDQQFSGLKNFTDNIIVNTIKIWRGGNNSPFNLAIGLDALDTSTGNQNTVIGYQALSPPIAYPSSFNTVVGYAAHGNGQGNNNTAIGWQSLSSAETNNNSALGYSSGLLLTTGFQNTFIGASAGGVAGQLISANNSTAIGYLTFTTKSNQVVLGNSLVTETVLRGTTLVDGGVFNAVDSLIVGGPVKSTQYKLTALNTAPASAFAAGTLGDIRITTAFIYVCTATNTWVRAALTSW